MDIGDWLFMGIAVVSGIASIAKATKKKESQQTSQQQSTTVEGKSDADDWIRNILRETTNSMFDTEDEFIPKNNPQPARTGEGSRQVSAPTAEKPSGNVVAESYRRTNKSLEDAARPMVSLEDTAVVEGEVKQTGLHTSMDAKRKESQAEKPLLNPIDDLKDVEEVRKAIIYGEIMRPKF